MFPFIQDISYDILVSASGTGSIFFHCWSWAVLSVVRYIYIVHPEVIDTKFPDQRTLSKLAIAALLSLSSLSMVIQFYTQTASGWPKIRFVELPPRGFALGLATVLTSLGLPIITSTVVTLILLHKRGKLGNNRVSDSFKHTSDANDDSCLSYGGVWMGADLESRAPEEAKSRSSATRSEVTLEVKH